MAHFIKKMNRNKMSYVARSRVCLFGNQSYHFFRNVVYGRKIVLTTLICIFCVLLLDIFGHLIAQNGNRSPSFQPKETIFRHFFFGGGVALDEAWSTSVGRL